MFHARSAHYDPSGKRNPYCRNASLDQACCASGRRIRGAIIDSLRNLDWAPRSLRKKGKDLERIYADLSQKLGRPATDEEVSAAMGEDLAHFHVLLDQLHGLTIGSFENMGDSEDSDNYINYYPDDGSNDPYARFESNELTGLLGEAIEELPEKERLVLSLYYYEEFTMKEIGTVLGVNESRVSQLHTKATLRLRSRLAKVVLNETAVKTVAG